MHLTDAELGRITDQAEMTFGSSSSSHITVHGLTDANTDAIATLRLVATKPAKLVVFDGAGSSFNKGVVVQAAGGVVLSESFASKQVSPLFQTGTGTLTIVGSKTLTSSNQLITILADDVDIQTSTVLIDSGTKAIKLNVSTNTKTIGLGSAAGVTTDMKVSDTELSTLSATGLTVGSSTNGSVTISGITAASSNNILEITTIMATRATAEVSFRGDASTFNTLVVQADAGISSFANINTDTTFLYLDGDADRSSVGESSSAIGFTDGRKTVARTVMTLQAATSLQLLANVVPAGALTL
jgi:hypothetical protein